MYVFRHGSEIRVYTPGMILNYHPGKKRIRANLYALDRVALEQGKIETKNYFISRKKGEFFVAYENKIIYRSSNEMTLGYIDGIYSQDDSALILAENAEEIIPGLLCPEDKIGHFKTVSNIRVICTHNYFVNDLGDYDITNVPIRLKRMTCGQMTFDAMYSILSN